jgi:hypothetical protein
VKPTSMAIGVSPSSISRLHENLLAGLSNALIKIVNHTRIKSLVTS